MNSIASLLSTLVSGLLFGLGLIIAGMTNPAKVQNFLDITGTWDPSLAFVMGGAIIVTMPAYKLLKNKTGPMFASSFQWPTATELDTRLLGGAAIFGIGWGASGFCPGPALTAIPFAFISDTSGSMAGLLAFVPALCVGLFAAKRFG